MSETKRRKREQPLTLPGGKVGYMSPKERGGKVGANLGHRGGVIVTKKKHSGSGGGGGNKGFT